MREVRKTVGYLSRSIPKAGVLVGVTGGSGAGKTTICEYLAKGGYRVVYPGRLIRKNLGDSANPKEMGSMAPESTEQAVRMAIMAEIETGGEGSLVVDGFPRSIEQVVWAQGVCHHLEMDFMVVIVEADREARWRRVKSRARRDAYDQKMAKTRFAQEARVLSGFLNEVRGGVRWALTVMNGLS